MAKKKKTSKPRSKTIIYKVTCYQIQIKGPKRNEALITLYNGLADQLKKGAPLAKQDKFGNVIRCLGTISDYKTRDPILTLIKYNTVKTGLKWNEPKKALVEDRDKDNYSAQRTELILDIEEHKAYHIHKSHGPNTSQICEYLFSIFKLESIRQKLDCDIDIIPLRIGKEVSKIKKWKTIKKFSIEVIRPNPDGVIRVKKLKESLEKTSSDKIKLEYAAKEKSGLIKSNLAPLIDEGARLVEEGQGRICAEGTTDSAKKVFVDSKDIKVKMDLIRVKDDDERSLAERILDYYADGH